MAHGAMSSGRIAGAAVAAVRTVWVRCTARRAPPLHRHPQRRNLRPVHRRRIRHARCSLPAPTAVTCCAWPPPAPARCGCRAARGASHACATTLSRWAWPAARHCTTAWCCGRGWFRRACSAARACPTRPSRCAGNWRTTRPSRASRSRARRRRCPSWATACMSKSPGWTPDRWYFYRFMVGGDGNDWVSPVGRTRTLPAADAKPASLRLAYASCQRWEHGYYSAWRHLRRRAAGRGGVPR